MAKITVVAKRNIYPDNCCTDPILAGAEFELDSSQRLYYEKMGLICVDNPVVPLIDCENIGKCRSKPQGVLTAWAAV